MSVNYGEGDGRDLNIGIKAFEAKVSTIKRIKFHSEIKRKCHLKIKEPMRQKPYHGITIAKFLAILSCLPKTIAVLKQRNEHIFIQMDHYRIASNLFYFLCVNYVY